MVFGKGTISWGLQVSYPQLFEDPVTRQVMNALDEEHFINARLFRVIRQWVRQYTRPTPLLIEGVKVNVSLRMGHSCLSWIQHHPDLQARGITIAI